jgi:AcrR family transcriptional regulator
VPEGTNWRAPSRAAPRRRGRPRAQRSEETEAEILRAARVAFSKTGYDRTSVAEIARAAGVTSRAVYHYVDSKPELFARAAAAAYRHVTSVVRAHVAGRRGGQDTMLAWIQAFRVLFADDPSLLPFLSLAAIEAERKPELVAALPDGTDISGLNRWLVEQGVIHGGLADDIDPVGAVTLLDVFSAGLAVLAGDNRSHDYPGMLDVLARLIAGTLFTEPTPAAPSRPPRPPSKRQ